MVTTARLAAVLMLWLVAVAAQAQAPTVTATIDRGTIRENESFTYTLRAEGRVSGEPDLSPIERDFDVLNRSTSARIQTINGRTEQVVEYVYQLIPRGPGSFTLPPIELGGELSNAVELTVEAAVAAGDDAPADIFMEVEVDPATAYVQAQVIYTLRLFVGVGIGRATLTQPLVTGGEAIVERLGEDSQYQTTRGNRSFTVRERRYAIFPQSAGTLTIGPSAFEAMVIPNRGFSRVQRLRSETVPVEVRAAVAPPPTHPNAVWLPARSLELTESWADNEDAFSLGVPRTRVLEITARGLLETQLPELEIGAAEGIRQYPDQPELERQITDAGLEVSRTQRYAVIAQRAGDARIPPAEIPWWNVTGERWEVARVEGSAVTVLPGDEAPPAPAPPEPTAMPVPLPADPGPWRLIAAVLGAGWLLTAAAWWWTAGAFRTRKADAEARAGKPASMPALARQIRAACQVGDAQRAGRMLLDWGRLRYPEAAPTSLGALAALAGGDLGDAISELETHLYGPRGGDWRGERLAALIGNARAARSAETGSPDDRLEPLYR